MIKVGESYKTVSGKTVKIMTMTTTATDIVFTGDNGIWYDRDGHTEHGNDLCLITLTVQPAYADELLTENEQELLQALIDLDFLVAAAYSGDETIKEVIKQARAVIAKFERVP
jgi:hypothetical protein